MRYLLDTNVISDGMSPRPSAMVRAWLTRRPSLDFAVSVLTLGEVHRGMALLPDGERRRLIHRWLSVDAPEYFADRILGVTAEVAMVWGELSAMGRRRGRALATVDGLLVATAQVHHLTLVTRNIRDCTGWGVEVVDPRSDT